MAICLQLPHEVLKDVSRSDLENILQETDEIILELRPCAEPLSGHLESLYPLRAQIYGLLKYSKPFEVAANLSYLPIWLREQLYFEPCSKMSGKHIYQLGQKITKSFPEMKYRPLPGLDQYDSRIPQEVELFLRGQELVSSQSAQPQIEVSVIIPAYEGTDFLVNSLRHLLKQNCNRNRFEVLVVDDGSPQAATNTLKSFLAPELGNFNFSYHHVPKTQKAGELLGSFRAGLCRNYGASFSKGSILSFLDSDMIVPDNYLEIVQQRLQQTDLLQFVRYHIKPSFSGKFTEIQALGKKDVYIEEESYWGPFFTSDDWMGIPDYWKYACTYSLSLKRETFLNLGKFRKTYVSYGFEDTDFGFTAHQKGLRFYLERTPLYHLTPLTEKARYRHSMYFKHKLMRTTAKTFFVNHLSPSIYEKLKIFLD